MSGILLASRSSARRGYLAVAPAESAVVTWDPLARQEIEPDTIFLFDPDVEQEITPGLGGWLAGGSEAGDTIWQDDSKVQVVDGKHRKGVVCGEDTSYGYIWRPCTGDVPTDEFTIEMNVGSAAGLVGMSGWAFSVDCSPDEAIILAIDSGQATVTMSHDQSPAATVSKTVHGSVSSFGAGQFASIAWTLKAGALKLYIGGTLVQTVTGWVPPVAWTDGWRSSGLTLCGRSGVGAPGLIVSDLRISRFARVPGVPLTVSRANTVTVDVSSPTGDTIEQGLRGSLHNFDAPAAAAISDGLGLLEVLRSDKVITACPIVEGAPDADHPHAGHSGQFSYNWGPLDRLCAYVAAHANRLLLTLDAAPEILGGPVAPFSGEKLATALPVASDFPNTLPNDFDKYATICVDVVWRCVVENELPSTFTLWNEPDNTTDFFAGTKADYLLLWKKVAAAIDALGLDDVKLGGPEIALPEQATDGAYIRDLIATAVDNDLPLPLITWHGYDGSLAYQAKIAAQIARYLVAAGWEGPPPRMANTEWNATSPAVFPGGNAPWNNFFYTTNDWAGAFVAAQFIIWQSLGFSYSVFTQCDAEAGDRSYESSGLVSSTHMWAPGIAFQMWSMLAPNVVPVTIAGDPGLFAVASTDGDGTVTVLVANIHYRIAGGPQNVTISLPGVTGTAVAYLMDDAHSNARDAGTDHAALETTPVTFASHEVTVAMKPRSVLLLQVTP